MTVAVPEVPGASLLDHKSVSSVQSYRNKTNKVLDELQKQSIVGASNLMNGRRG